jgi:hypothetical protein
VLANVAKWLVGVRSEKAGLMIEEGGNYLADNAFDCTIAFDSHMKPFRYIIQHKPLEKVSQMLILTSSYPIENDRILWHGVNITGYMRTEDDEWKTDHKRDPLIIIIDGEKTGRFRTSSGIAGSLIMQDAMKATVVEVRKKAADHIRLTMAGGCNARNIDALSDDELLETYRVVPVEAIAKKLKFESCAIVPKKVFENCKVVVEMCEYVDRYEFMGSFVPWVRDSMGMKLNVRNQTFATEKYASVSDAQKWCSSYTLLCEERRIVSIKYDTGTIELSCGYVTNDYNTMLNKHSCIRTKMAGACSRDGGVNLRIHGSYECKVCKYVYQSNINAMICGSLCEQNK